jgi:hypothetical protein
VAGKISGNSVVVVTKDQVSADLSGEAAILNLKSGIYYGLNNVGARIWNLLQEPKTINQIRDAILDEYAVERDQCGADLVALLEELLSKGLIEVKDEKGP